MLLLSLLSATFATSFLRVQSDQCPSWASGSYCSVPDEADIAASFPVGNAGQFACAEFCANVGRGSRSPDLLCAFDSRGRCSVLECPSGGISLEWVEKPSTLVCAVGGRSPSEVSRTPGSIGFLGQGVGINEEDALVDHEEDEVEEGVVKRFRLFFTYLTLIVSLLSLCVSFSTLYLVYNIMGSSAVERMAPTPATRTSDESMEMTSTHSKSVSRQRFYSIIEDMSTISALKTPTLRMSILAPAGMPQRVTAAEGAERPPLDFNGCWKCVDTFGLDQFLQKMKVGRLQRMAANKAPWPTWEFNQAGNMFRFVNHSAMGDIVEEFEVGGNEYTFTDLKQNVQVCKAYWENGVLKIDKVIPGQGSSTESRVIENDKLKFSIYVPNVDFTWGRTFERAE